MTRIAANKVVTIHYTLKNDDGETLDASTREDPLLYLHGAENIVPGLEAALSGKQVGDAIQAVVAPEDGYGELDGAEPRAFPRSLFEGVEPRPGMTFFAEDDDGNEIPLWILHADDDTVTVSSNHPLAGVTLHFEVEVLEIRDATDEELEHGHVHAHGGHH